LSSPTEFDHHHTSGLPDICELCPGIDSENE
jgi:hypothetical protein